MMSKWGNIYPSQVPKCLNTEKIGARTYNRRLTMLQAFFKWAVKLNITGVNPLEEVARKKTQKAINKKRIPFSQEEIHAILEAVKHDAVVLHRLDSSILPIILFQYSGSF
jgi:site-specific recombinase XerD